MAQTTTDGMGRQTAASLTHGQMARALRIAAERGEEARGAGWAWVDAPAAAEHGGAPPIAIGAGHGHARVRAGSTITFAMLVAGTLVAAQLSGNEGDFVGGVASGARSSGSIPGNAARPRGGDAVAGSRQEQPEMLKKFTSVAVSVGAAAAIAGSASAQAVQWSVASGGNGHWYQFVAAGASWSAASTGAQGMGGHLVTLSSAAEANFIRTLGSGAAWFGLFQNRNSPSYSEPAGGWEWVNGEPLAYTNWRVNTNGQPNEPNNLGGEDFGILDGPTAITWNDGAGTGPFPYFVEWSADCNNDGAVDYGQIRAGQLVDANSNNIPDCCENGTSCDQLAVGLQVHYMLDGNCLDASGNGRNGAATGIIYVAGPGGVANTAASFDGSTSFVQVDGIPIPADNSFSWALWLRVEGLGASYAYVIERIAGIGTNLLSPALSVQSNGSLAFDSCCTAGGSRVATPANTIAPGAWTHVACTSSTDGVRRVYANGTLLGEGFAVDYGQQLPKLLIGRDRLDCCDRFRGAIDDLRIYSRPLSATEIAALYSSGAPCIGDIYIDNRVDGGDLGVLLSYWGPTTSNSASVACDLNRDGRVDGSDLGMLLANWGPCGN
jgi:hypothetical protein